MSFCLMPWNLNPCFPLVIPSGPRDSLGDLAHLPGSGSGAAWMDGLQHPACRDWGWLCSHLASLGPLCSLLHFPEQLRGGPQALLSSRSALPELQDDMGYPFFQPGAPHSRWEKYHICNNNNHIAGTFQNQSIFKIRDFLGKPHYRLKHTNVCIMCFLSRYFA